MRKFNLLPLSLIVLSLIATTVTSCNSGGNISKQSNTSTSLKITERDIAIKVYNTIVRSNGETQIYNNTQYGVIRINRNRLAQIITENISSCPQIATTDHLIDKINVNRNQDGSGTIAIAFTPKGIPPNYTRPANCDYYISSDSYQYLFTI